MCLAKLMFEGIGLLILKDAEAQNTPEQKIVNYSLYHMPTKFFKVKENVVS